MLKKITTLAISILLTITLVTFVSGVSATAAAGPVRATVTKTLIVKNGVVTRKAVLRFTNNQRKTITIKVGNRYNARPDWTRSLKPGASATFRTSRKSVHIQEKGKRYYYEGTVNTRTKRARYAAGNPDYAAW